MMQLASYTTTDSSSFPGSLVAAISPDEPQFVVVMLRPDTHEEEVVEGQKTIPAGFTIKVPLERWADFLTGCVNNSPDEVLKSVKQRLR